MIYTEMKNRVKEIRKKVGLSQYQLAHFSGLAQSTISHIERGLYMPTIDSAYKIAAVLNVRVDELFIPEARELPKPYDAQEGVAYGRKKKAIRRDHAKTGDGGV